MFEVRKFHILPKLHGDRKLTFQVSKGLTHSLGGVQKTILGL